MHNRIGQTAAALLMVLSTALSASAFAEAGEDIKLSANDKKYALNLARQTLFWRLTKGSITQLDAASVPAALKKQSGAFVLFRERKWNNRGRSGSFDTSLPLYQNIINATVAAVDQGEAQGFPMTLRDPEHIKIEISVVTEPKDLSFSSVNELLAGLKKGKDGVVLFTKYGSTSFLPKVWEFYPDKKRFLSRMCRHHSAPENTWETDVKNIKVQTFQSVWFQETTYDRKPRSINGARAIKQTKQKRSAKATNGTHAKVPTGPAVRGGNRSISPVSDLKLHWAEASESIQITALQSKQLSKYFPVPGKPTALVGEYKLAGSKQKVYISKLSGPATLVIQDNGYVLQRAETALTIHPYPKEVSVSAGAFDVNGKSIFIPAGSGKKATTVANTLADHLKHHLKLSASPKVESNGSSAQKLYVLSIGLKPDGWSKHEKNVSFDSVIPTLQSQAYSLTISADGVFLASPGARGLSYGVITLIQLARSNKQLPCLSITDWPEMEFRATHTASPGVKAEDRLEAAQLAWEGKMTALLWELPGGIYGYDSHPEVSRNRRSKDTMKNLAKSLHSLGIDFVPCHQMALGHYRQSRSYPYLLIGDCDTYDRAMFEIIDEDLEVFCPRTYNLMMDEEKFIHKLLLPGRGVTEWQNASIKFMKHLRRRGVMGMKYTDILEHVSWYTAIGRKHDYFKFPKSNKKYPDIHREFTSKYPKDLILGPWYYWAKNPEMILGGRGDLQLHAESGNPVILAARAHLVEKHISAIKMVNKKHPNTLGLVNAGWGASKKRFPNYVSIIRGPSWNQRVPNPPLDFEPETTKFPTNWGCLLDAEPASSVESALKELRSPNWRVWTQAREQLVASGLPVAPALLAAMSKEKDEEQQARIEGCMSRAARDSRNGIDRGKLDVTKVTPFTKDPHKFVRDMAAELIASAGKKEAASLKGLVKDPAAGPSAIRALGLIKDSAAASTVIAVLEDKTLPDKNRAEAARVLGVMKTKESVASLVAALTDGAKPTVQKEAMWALALLKHKPAGKDVAPLLKSSDEETKLRAAVALRLLESPEAKQVESWLSSSDRKEVEVAGWVMWNTWDYKDAKRAVTAAMKKQTDATSKKRLDQFMKLFSGKAPKSVHY